MPETAATVTTVLDLPEVPAATQARLGLVGQ
jgi:hypothetical protein